MKRKAKKDVRVYVDETMIGFEPITDAALQFMAEAFFDEGWRWRGNIMYVEHRLREQVYAILEDADLAVE